MLPMVVLYKCISLYQRCINVVVYAGIDLFKCYTGKQFIIFPISFVLSFQLLLQEDNHGIQYEYNVPYSASLGNHNVTQFTWTHSAWTECSHTCAKGEFYFTWRELWFGFSCRGVNILGHEWWYFRISVHVEADVIFLKQDDSRRSTNC